MTQHLRRVKRLCQIQKLLATQQETHLSIAMRRSNLFADAASEIRKSADEAMLDRYDGEHLVNALKKEALALQSRSIEKAHVSARRDEHAARENYLRERIGLDQMTTWRDSISTATQRHEAIQEQKMLDDRYIQRRHLAVR